MSINANIIGNVVQRRGFVPPNYSDLKFLWNGAYDGTSLKNLVGNNPTYVSGTGLDAIYDFGVLTGDEFDKGSYIGNSLGLPEIYDFPYPSEIYYDPTSATTRKYWKLKDFHYFWIQKQMDITPQVNNNIFFLKAKATTDTSNILASISALYIYGNEQTGADLTRLKREIGIQPDFYGDDLLTGYDFTSGWLSADATINNSNQFTANANGGRIYKTSNIYCVGCTYRIHVSGSVSIGYIRHREVNGSIYSEQLSGNYDDVFAFTSLKGKSPLLEANTSGAVVVVNTFVIQMLYQNYYKS